MVLVLVDTKAFEEKVNLHCKLDCILIYFMKWEYHCYAEYTFHKNKWNSLRPAH